MEPGEKIGDGRTAEVFAWGNDRALKLFREGWERSAAAYEAAIAQRLFDAGVPSPAVYEVIEHAGRFGVVYERIDGPTLLDQLLKGVIDSATGGRILAETQAHVHAARVPGLRTVREKLSYAIQRAGPLPEQLRGVALRALDQLPDGDALCHGDYHPDNVLLSPRGPLVIDWENASVGHPAADLARSELLLTMASYSFPEGAERMALEANALALWNDQFASYTHITGMRPEEIAPWRLPIAAARLAEGIDEEEPHVLARIVMLAQTLP